MAEPTPPRCPTCKNSSKNARNLAVFIDGTSNKPGEKSTSVWKLSEQVKMEKEGFEPEQAKPHYLEGIGAYYNAGLPLHQRIGKAIYSGFEMAFAWNVEENVKNAYDWLADNYREGDQIYLFGFSRGAYQVRTLATMIHEVGLVKMKRSTNSAYHHYLSIDPCNPETRRKAMDFKTGHCWLGVRVHFVGIWDTVSSLGLIKKDVHVSASTTVTNACHFRHALALDERRVKFMPEYFSEVNAYHSKVRSQRSAVGDVKEVWFAGCHADVGGTSRGYPHLVSHPEDEDFESHSVHAGNVPLLWMRREAAACGLVFKPEQFTWDPEDVDLGREDSMKVPWKYLEKIPIRHQVSFSGAGIHKRKRHLSRSRSVIPGQQIHTSVLSGDMYAPLATLRENVEIPNVSRGAADKLWATERPGEGAAANLLPSLLSDHKKVLESFEKVLFLLDSNNSQTQAMAGRVLQWPISEQSDPDKVALTAILDVLSNFPDEGHEELLANARTSLCNVLSTQVDSLRAFYVLRFSAKHVKLRQRLIDDDGVISALVDALQWTANSCNVHLFPLVADSLRYLINDGGLRGKVIDQLSTRPDEPGQTRLSMVLDSKECSHLIMSLKMIVSLAQYRPDLCRELKPKIFELAETQRGHVGSAAVGVLATLHAPLTGDIHLPNLLGYLGSILPPLDAETGYTSLSNTDGLQLPSVLQTPDSGTLDKELMRKVVSAIESRDAHERTAATLTLLKLCRNTAIRGYCSEIKVVDVLMKQMERKDTSLLSAYALGICLKQNMVTPSEFDRAAGLIVTMLEKGWFDDAIGLAEGFKIFGGLMQTGNLRQKVMDHDIVTTLMQKLEGGERHDVRTSLICRDILESNEPAELMPIVERSIDNLKASSKKTQMKGVKMLAALAKTPAGEEAIKPHVIDIVKMLLPSLGDQLQPCAKFFGPTAALYDLSKNENLREVIRDSLEFKRLTELRRVATLRPQARPRN